MGEHGSPMSGLRARALSLAMRAIVLGCGLPEQIGAQQPADVLPSFQQLEAAQARIGEVRVRTTDVFDTADEKEGGTFYRWANALHVQTRASVIGQALLFKSGDPVSVAVIDETERLLRGTRYLYDVQIRAAAYRDGVVDIDVVTRDSWSLIPGLSAARSGGVNTTGIRLREYNLLGTGSTLGIGHFDSVDRSGDELLFSNERLFGTHVALSASVARNSDGHSNEVSVVRPFYSLDARWAAGASAADGDRIDAVYNAGQVISEYRHRLQRAELFAGWSNGRVDGWAQRWSLGMDLRDDAYAIEPGRTAPPQLPTDERLIGPFVRYELIEDRYAKVVNRDTIGMPEFFALGLTTLVQIGWASSGLGSNRDALLYAASVSRGFEFGPDHTLLATAAISGQHTEGRVYRQRSGVEGKYYLPQSPRWLFYAAASAGVLTHPDVLDMFTLGGDSGLRGYPLRYQAGNRRVLLTLEERAYSDLFIWQLLRVGGAAFVDVGRAWGGPHVNTSNPGWLADVGFGLRIASVRTALKDVLHLDIAFPLNATPDIKKVQFLVKARSSF